MRLKLLLLLTFCVLLFIGNGVAQGLPKPAYIPPPDTVLHIYVQRLGMRFRLPNGFHRDSVIDYVCGNGSLVSSISYALINKSNDIIILMIFMDRSAITPEKTAMLRRINPDYDPEKNYLVWIRVQSDTSYKAIHYPRAYIRKTSRADDAGEYVLNCPNPYKKVYNHCKVVFMHKEKRGDVLLYYFYTDAAKKKIDRCIKKTARMMRYN